MNNLYRELAPVSAAAWAGIEEEAKRTFARHAAARKAVDVTGPEGLTLAGMGTGHVTAIDPPADGVGGCPHGGGGGRGRGAGEPPPRGGGGGEPARLASGRGTAGAVHAFPQPDRLRRARRARPRLAAGQGRREEDRLRRGPGGLRRLRGRPDHRGAAGVVQPRARAARRGGGRPPRGQQGGAPR